MNNIGLPEIVVMLMSVAIYGLILLCVWKFYQLLSKINDNLSGIRQAIERNGAGGPGQRV
jgi:hypothetical protein